MTEEETKKEIKKIFSQLHIEEYIEKLALEILVFSPIEKYPDIEQKIKRKINVK